MREDFPQRGGGPCRRPFADAFGRSRVHVAPPALSPLPGRPAGAFMNPLAANTAHEFIGRVELGLEPDAA